MIHVRPMENHQFDFLMDMHYESIYILEDKPTKHQLLNAPNMLKYSEGWGRKGDRALIALENANPVGAVWYRLFDETNRGYGFVDSDTPELGIAIHPEHRQKGSGRILMHEIIKQAESDGYRRLSLSVDPDNKAAVQLYEKLGFTFFGIEGTSWTMKLDLAVR